ncbi:MAG: ribonuclease HI [Desulfovibrio sp.]|nr:ribonuclease HI [Desulfovibrio sp.]
MANEITIYTDGSCLGNPGPGGWACRIFKQPDDTNPLTLSGGFSHTTNNRMEIISVLEALKALPEPSCVQIYSDSQYVCSAIEKGWLSSWIKKNWVNSSKQPVKNKDLWLLLLVELNRHKVTMHWLRGHAGQPENERCDALARSIAESGNLPPDTGYHS